MGKFEGIIKDEMVRLARREMKKSFVPLSRDVRSLKSVVSKLRKAVGDLRRFVAQRAKEAKGRALLEAAPEEVKKSRFSPRLMKSLRKRLGVSQKEMATLAGVSVGAIYQWEKGAFDPRGEKRRVLVALRKLGRRDARRILEEKKGMGKKPKENRPARRRSRKRTPSRK